MLAHKRDILAYNITIVYVLCVRNGVGTVLLLEIYKIIKYI